MQAPELAVKEMERCVKELGFPGVQIGSHINEWDLNTQELYPVYAVSMWRSLSQWRSRAGYCARCPWAGEMSGDMQDVRRNVEIATQNEGVILLESRQVEMLPGQP